MALIGIMTDFGSKGMHYVAEMKGIGLKINPEANFIDITHNITPFSIIEAAYILFSTYNSFPEGSIFVCVVDPGVGSNRDIVALQTKDNYILIGPNNGIFSYFQIKNLIAISLKITELDFFNPPYAEALKRKRNRRTMTMDLEKTLEHTLESKEAEKDLLRVDENSPSIFHPDLPPDLSPSLENDTIMNIPRMPFIDAEKFVPSDDDFNPLDLERDMENMDFIENPTEAKRNKYATLDVVQTFHGRDIMMPAAAHLAKGLSIFSLGEPIEHIVIIEGIEPELSDDRHFILARIQYIDAFGNIITNIPIFEFQMLAMRQDSSYVMIYNEKRYPLKLTSHFEGNSQDEYLLINGSSGFLEICLNKADAARELLAQVDSPFQIEMIGSAFSEFFPD